MSQLVTLTVYGKLCYGDLKQTYIDRSGSEIKAQVNLGPGYYFYVVCLFGAFMRALMHWLTPLPGQGSGCKPRLPQYIIEMLDADGDGKISWNEMRLAYAVYVKKRNRESIAAELGITPCTPSLRMPQQQVTIEQPTTETDGGSGSEIRHPNHVSFEDPVLG